MKYLENNNFEGFATIILIAGFIAAVGIFVDFAVSERKERRRNLAFKVSQKKREGDQALSHH
ncbi:hypothetical protein ACM55F_10150 [Flavobacterium sp. XS2P12]|uniref:hypothetical protein n=1 Tax=Flavobacterium melibiosi TaxID=3398734 RepID=UPI003A872118